MVGDPIYFVYIVGSYDFGTLYTGVTNDLVARSYDHRTGAIPGFTKRYGAHKLFWFEITAISTSPSSARSALNAGGGYGRFA